MTAATTARHVCPPEHGHETRTTCYKAHGCRCLPCRAGNAAAVTAAAVRAADRRLERPVDHLLADRLHVDARTITRIRARSSA